jgi:23S rRNA pseudouridine2605 synthase
VTAEPGERLQKVLARAGVGSRRACEDLIRAGRVSVNGRAAELGTRIDPDKDEVTVDGVGVSLSADLVYLALHKPVGVLTAARDARGRSTVADLVPDHPRVFPVGRLDLDTSGLLLLTNDGEFANHIAHPRYGVPKTYVVEARGVLDRVAVRKLTDGIDLPDGPARADSARVRATGRHRVLVELVVREGRNRLVRRMLEAMGLEVLSLVRTAVGPVRLGRLKAGEWRALKYQELQELRRAAGGSAHDNT